MINSFSRYYLDKKLSEINFYGNVLDVGGHRDNRRGRFRPPKSIEAWHYLNCDSKVRPDFVASAERMPIPDCKYDMVIFTQVFEHLENPLDALREIYRVLKQGGHLVLSVPFMFQVHGCPYDFQRWTKLKILKELESLQFCNITLEEMGSSYAVIWDILRNTCKGKSILSRIEVKFLQALAPLFILLDRNCKNKNNISGYFVKASK